MIGHTITNNRLKHIHKLINKLQQKNITPNNQIIPYKWIQKIFPKPVNTNK